MAALQEELRQNLEKADAEMADFPQLSAHEVQQVKERISRYDGSGDRRTFSKLCSGDGPTIATIGNQKIAPGDERFAVPYSGGFTRTFSQFAFFQLPNDEAVSKAAIERYNRERDSHSSFLDGDLWIANALKMQLAGKKGVISILDGRSQRDKYLWTASTADMSAYLHLSDFGSEKVLPMSCNNGPGISIMKRRLPDATEDIQLIQGTKEFWSVVRPQLAVAITKIDKPSAAWNLVKAARAAGAHEVTATVASLLRLAYGSHRRDT